MDIISRLNKFLNSAGISSTQFADMCDLPRPSASQLLNGRNKKVSNEVLEKIHKAFPELSMQWLIFGEGNQRVPASYVEPPTPPKSIDKPSEHKPDADPTVEDIFHDNPIDDNEIFSNETKVLPQPIVSESPKQNKETEYSKAPVLHQSSNCRFIKSIIVIYSDGTTETLLPS